MNPTNSTRIQSTTQNMENGRPITPFLNRLFLTCAATGFPAIAHCRIDTIRSTMEGLGGINGVDEATTIWVSMRAM